MTEEKPEVFRGHFEECLRHLGTKLVSSAPKGSRRTTQVRRPIADFCGVSTISVGRWFDGIRSVLPIGEPLIKLMCYLDMVGYRVIELERMHSTKRNFLELLGFGLLSSKQAVELLGYSSTSTLYQVLYGHAGIGEDKNQKMWNAWKERKEALEQKKEEARKLYDLGVPSEVGPRAEEIRPAVVLPSRKPAVVSIMEGLLAVLEDGSFEQSEGNLAGLQHFADTVLRLSARMSDLSSRLIVFEQQRKGGS